MPEPLAIDGARGGQVLRTSLSLSTLTGKPFIISNIRAARPKPGLQPQHFTAVKLLAGLCGAEVQGAAQQGKQLAFYPRQVRPVSLQTNVGTAGSVTLLLQALLLPSLLAEVKLRAVGGTDVPFAPSAAYFSEVLLPALRPFGARFDFELQKHGYYPKGNGAVSFRSHPATKWPLKSVDYASLGQLQSIHCLSHCSSLPRDVALNQARAARRTLAEFECEWKETIEARPQSDTLGSGIDLIACFDNGARLGANALGKKDKPAAKVGEEAGASLLQELQALKPVDRHLADQLIPFMGLAKGTSTFLCSEVTEHLLANLEVTKQFLGCEYKVEGELGKPGKVEVKGVAFKPGAP